MKKEFRIALMALCLVLTTPAPAADPDSGRQIYDVYCMSCHGAGGRLDADSQVVQALGVIPADFSDPLFNSREPAADWEMVIRHGGHAMGLAEQMPPQGELLSGEQIEDVTAYLKSIVDTSAFPPGEMNLMLPIRTKKAFRKTRSYTSVATPTRKAIAPTSKCWSSRNDLARPARGSLNLCTSGKGR